MTLKHDIRTLIIHVFICWNKVTLFGQVVPMCIRATDEGWWTGRGNFPFSAIHPAIRPMTGKRASEKSKVKKSTPCFVKHMAPSSRWKPTSRPSAPSSCPRRQRRSLRLKRGIPFPSADGRGRTTGTAQFFSASLPLLSDRRRNRGDRLEATNRMMLNS